MGDIMLLISQAMRLNKIRVENYLPNWNDVPIDAKKTGNLTAMNMERHKLTKGRNFKVTIYIDEKGYSATKWALKRTNPNTD